MYLSRGLVLTLVPGVVSARAVAAGQWVVTGAVAAAAGVTGAGVTGTPADAVTAALRCPTGGATWATASVPSPHLHVADTRFTVLSTLTVLTPNLNLQAL